MLIVEDDPKLRKALKNGLAAAGFVMSVARDSQRAVRHIREHPPDALIIDCILPGTSGLSFLTTVRGSADTAALPVIMLIASSAEADIVQALDAGADDCIVKPVSLRELCSRVHAVLRRCKADEPALPNLVRCGDLVLDVDAHRIWLKGREIRVSATEFALLHVLATHSGEVFTRPALLEHIWGADHPMRENTINVRLSRLRKALSLAGGEQLIQTVHKVGYRFSSQID